jgi:small-conductance mechanosensitive channel
MMTAFGDNSVMFELILWSAKPWEARPAVSMMNEAIWTAFQQAGIVIAFPQVDVHLDDAVVAKLAAGLARPPSAEPRQAETTTTPQ